ncbi:hypothetical protein Csa_011205 [Cucumis sativus]|uniref:Uncharacterized protein n=1 Tax=Cucumis sativus TaxID=3659 RepID=A0A0A0L7U0_CUCSA|nr:hypothetical protein Csa_011205 [Cucumis sativus]
MLHCVLTVHSHARRCMHISTRQDCIPYNVSFPYNMDFYNTFPFHITWSTLDGYINEDDNKIRTLNYSVLERAPGSVAILGDRGNLGRKGVKTLSTRMRSKYSVVHA